MRNPVYDAMVVVAESLVGTAILSGLWLAVAPQLGWPRVVSSVRRLVLLHRLGKISMTCVALLLAPFLIELLTDFDGYGGWMTRSAFFNSAAGDTSWWINTATEWELWIYALAPVTFLAAIFGWTCGAWLHRKCVQAVESRWKGRCPRCRYALHGLVVSRCPECGTVLAGAALKFAVSD